MKLESYQDNIKKLSKKNPNDCKDKDKFKLTPFQKFITIMALIGTSTVMGLVFMTIIFSGERSELTPFLGLVYIDHMTEGENWIMFMWSFILAIFMGLLLIWIIYRYYRTKKCANIEEEIESYDQENM